MDAEERSSLELLRQMALIMLLFLCSVFPKQSVFPRLSAMRKNILANMGLARTLHCFIPVRLAVCWDLRTCVSALLGAASLLIAQDRSDNQRKAH